MARNSRPRQARGANAIALQARTVFRGKVMSAEFTAGAYALRDALREGECVIGDEDDEHRAAELLTEHLGRPFPCGDERQAGALAALAHWLVIIFDGVCPSAEDWIPLDATYDGDPDEPHPLSSFFEVAGEPVAVTPDLVARRWVADVMRCKAMSVEVVRALGKPISRRRFDAMREAQTAG